MKIVLSESQYNRFIKSFILKENDEIVYQRNLSQVDLTAKRTFKDLNVQKSWDNFKQAEKKFSTMMKSHGSKYNYKFPCSEPSKGYNVQILNACAKSVYDEYNLKNRDLYNMSKYLEWARLFLPSWNETYPNVYQYQIMTTPEGLGMMRSAYSSCKKAGNYDCSSFMDYYNKIGKNIDSNVYQLSPDELDLLKKQWAALHAIAQAAKSRNPVKVVQSVVKAGVEGGIATVEQAVAWVKENFDGFMEGLRGFVSGIAGGVINTVLELTGVGALAVSVQWAALLIYDFSKKNWIKFIFSLLGLLTSGKLGQALYKPFQGIWKTKVTSVENGISTIVSNPAIKNYMGKSVDLIVSGVKFVANGLKSAGNWLINTFNITWAQSAITWILSKLQVIIKALTGQANDALVQKASEKVATKLVIDPANTYIANTAGVGDEYKMVKAGSDVTKGGSVQKDPAKVVGGATKIVNKATGG
jgi:hypothetical protein